MPWPRADRLEQRNLLLTGQQIALREKRIEDVMVDYEWRVDPELAKLDASTPLRLTLDEYTRYFRDELEFPSPWSVRLAVETFDGEHIGNVMYYDVDERMKQAELGIMIGIREYWGRGYGTDVVATVLKHIFLDTGLERVYLHTLSWNDRAQSAFKKSGFKVVRDITKDGYEFLLMDITREDWLADHPEAVVSDDEPVESRFDSGGRISGATN